MKAYQKQFIDLALAYDVLSFGEFTLKSGRKSPYFFNAGKFNDGQAILTLGECYAAALCDADIPMDGLFGPAYKGIPLVVSTAIALTRQGKNLPYTFNRKSGKDHGEGGMLVGAPLKGNIVLVDDVITAGTAVRASLPFFKPPESTLSGLIIALDRQERGQNEASAVMELQELGLKVISIVTLDDILHYVTADAALSQWAKPIEDYRAAYGCVKTGSPDEGSDAGAE